MKKMKKTRGKLQFFIFLENCNFPRFFFMFFHCVYHFFIIFYHFFVIFLFFYFLSCFIIFYHFSSVPPLEAKMINKKLKK